ncbi:MAG: hypothetical protein WAL85_02435 [Candidatus Korobacteraceae bacterium]
MKKWVFLVVWALAPGWLVSAPASAQTASFATQFYGTWYPYPLGNPSTGSTRYEFRHNPTTGKDEITLTRTCPGEYRTAVAKVSTAVEISENSIHVLKAASDTQTGEGDAMCRISIAADVMGYTLAENGKRVTITDPGGKPDILELLRQDVINGVVIPTNFYGSWVLPPFDDKDTRIQIRLVFYNDADSNSSNVRQVISCSKGDNSLIAQVDSAITIGNDQITILDSAAHEEHDGAFVCKATLAAETLHYALSPNGAIMTLSKPGEKPLVLTREH